MFHGIVLNLGNMGNLSENWRSMLSGAKYDQYHFTTLFSEVSQPEQVADLLADFSGADELSERIEKALEAKRCGWSVGVDGRDLANEAISELSRFFAHLGRDEIVKYLATAEVCEVSKDDCEVIRRREGFHQSEISGEIGDEFIDRLFEQPVRFRHLEEALYGIDNEYIIPHYVLAPTIGFVIDFSMGFSVWQAGYQMAFDDEKIVYCRR
ncbi:hypothetical protein [Aliiroseovarius crassostreae]|uniref:hypothetical protein n=1 Tax=Aliiroseovarius crassostreae TaxID=154981 RepID=UPI002208DCB6|nr:hypothetical protein [Aliiroseovarius crassostreae]UWQ09733.1 hypothetical protein K3X25_15200 [Aliiroseovarius crassostreae]